MKRFYSSIVVVMLVVLGGSRAQAQEAETETARVLPSGVVEAGAGVEYQVSSEGTESAIPTIVEGGIADRLELIVEQVAFTAIRPSTPTGMDATGIGDLEVTVLGLALHERASVPALAFAAELKVPTARNQLIGTKKADYTGYVIASKRLGRVDLHVNGSYSVIGKPQGVAAVDNVFGFGVLVRYDIGRADLFGEALGHTAAIPEVEGMDGAAELSGSELFGTLGAGYWVRPWMQLYFAVSYDNNQAVLLHPGLTLRSNLF